MDNLLKINKISFTEMNCEFRCSHAIGFLNYKVTDITSTDLILSLHCGILQVQSKSKSPVLC